MDDAEGKAKMEEMLEEERAEGQYGWWWLSFAEASPPKGRGFLGACLVQANGFGSAVVAAGLQHLNPGGEVVGVPDSPGMPEPLPEFTNRLLNRQECAEFYRRMSEFYPECRPKT